MNNCNCWKEVSQINTEAHLVKILLLNTNDEDSGYIKVTDKEDIPLEIVKIEFCPFCGRKL